MAVTSSREVLARLETRMPGGLAEHAASQDSAGTVGPVEPAAAATVALLRDGADGLESYLLHRHARMPFAPGMVVFPGGRVDPADTLDRDGPPGQDGWRTCAVRETREETGVLLTAGDLVDWAHWVTPAFEPRRYDTRFYLAGLPAGQDAQDLSGETDRAGWSRPADALADADAGRIALMPPTRSVLIELSGFATVTAALAAGADRRVEVVVPEPVLVDGVWWFRYPEPGAADG